MTATLTRYRDLVDRSGESQMKGGQGCSGSEARQRLSWLGVAAASVMIGGLAEMPATADCPCQSGSGTLRYTITDIGPCVPNGTLDSNNSFGLNNLGQCVGTHLASGGIHAWVWLPSSAYGLAGGVKHDLNTLFGMSSTIVTRANDINDNGIIIGSAVINGIEQGYVWDLTTTPITHYSVGTLPVSEGFSTSILHAVNNASPPVAVGWSYSDNVCDDGTPHAFEVVLDGSITLDVLDASLPNDGSSWAMDVNSASPRQVVGYFTPIGENEFCQPQCFDSGIPQLCEGGERPSEWKPGLEDMSLVSSLGYYTNHRVLGNNDDEQMVGWGINVFYPSGQGPLCRLRAVYWHNASALAEDLHLGIANPINAEDQSVADAIRPDDSGLSVYQVVGMNFSQSRALLWEANKIGTRTWTVYDLTERLCCSYSGVWEVLNRAYDINSDGWILGYGDQAFGGGNDYHAFLLIPVESCPPVCVGDLNGDGTVGPADMGALLGAWGNPGCGGSIPCPADLNCDGVVGPADLGMLLGNWGSCDGGESFIEPPGGDLDEEGLAAWIEFLNSIGQHELAELLQSLLGGS